MNEPKGIGIEFTIKMIDGLQTGVGVGLINVKLFLYTERPLTFEEQGDVVKFFRLLLAENKNLRNNRTQEVNLALEDQINILRNQLFTENKDKIDELTKQFRDQLKKKDQMLQNQTEQIQKLLIKVYTPQSIQQKIVSDNTNELIKKVEQEYEKIYLSFLDHCSQLKEFFSNTKNEQEQYLESQEKAKEQGKFIKFDQIQAKFQESIKCLSELIKSINKQIDTELDERLKVTLQNMNLILSHNLKIFENSSELFKQASQDQSELFQKNQKLVEENQKLKNEINNLIEEYFKSVEQMENKFNEGVQKYQDVLSLKRIGFNYPQQELSALSQLSLKIHEEFLLSISKDLKALGLDVIKATFNNIIGFLLLCKDDQKKEISRQVLAETEKWDKELENPEILQGDFVKKSIEFFQKFPLSNTEEAKQFYKSKECNQQVLLQLQKCNQTILEGEKKFKDEHSKLQNLNINN